MRFSRIAAVAVVLISLGNHASAKEPELAITFALKCKMSQTKLHNLLMHVSDPKKLKSRGQYLSKEKVDEKCAIPGAKEKIVKLMKTYQSNWKDELVTSLGSPTYIIVKFDNHTEWVDMLTKTYDEKTLENGVGGVPPGLEEFVAYVSWPIFRKVGDEVYAPTADDYYFAEVNADNWKYDDELSKCVVQEIKNRDNKVKFVDYSSTIVPKDILGKSLVECMESEESEMSINCVKLRTKPNQKLYLKDLVDFIMEEAKYAMPTSSILLSKLLGDGKNSLGGFLGCPEQSMCVPFEVGKKNKFKTLYSCGDGQSQKYIATPSDLRSLYNIPTPVKVHPESGIGEVEISFPNYGWNQFYSNLMNDEDVSIQPPINFGSDNRGVQIASQCTHPTFMTPIGSPSGKQKPKCFGGEVTLDFQVLAAVAPKLPTYVYQQDSAELFQGWLQQMSDHEGAPYIWSTSISTSVYLPPCAAGLESYSTPDEKCELYDVPAFNSMRHQEVEFLKLGLRGYTLFVASGDGGSGQNNYHYKEQYTLKDNCGFRVAWPMGSAYWTVVGGTSPPDNVYDPTKTQVLSQVKLTGDWANNGITSSGGFSTISSREKYSPWQNGAVENYMKVQYDKIDDYYKQDHVNVSVIDYALNPPNNQKKGNACNMLGHYTGRGFPDISANSWFMSLWLGENSAAGGTSEASPLAAAMFALINNELMLLNKARVGFINPTLYYLENATDIFTDVVGGNNAGNKKGNVTDYGWKEPCESSYGFDATPGWDAASGLGYIQYPGMLREMMNLMPDVKSTKSKSSKAKETKSKTSKDKKQ